MGISFVIRNGKVFDGNSRWTPKHMQWLRTVKLDNAIDQETLSEYIPDTHAFEMEEGDDAPFLSCSFHNHRPYRNRHASQGRHHVDHTYFMLPML